MNIRFTSSLTPEDENMVAPALLRALTGFLDLLPIAYVIRIDTTDSKVYEQSGGMGAVAAIADGIRPHSSSALHGHRIESAAVERHR